MLKYQEWNHCANMNENMCIVTIARFFFVCVLCYVCAQEMHVLTFSTIYCAVSYISVSSTFWEKEEKCLFSYF